MRKPTLAGFAFSAFVLPYVVLAALLFDTNRRLGYTRELLAHSHAREDRLITTLREQQEACHPDVANLGSTRYRVAEPMRGLLLGANGTSQMEFAACPDATIVRQYPKRKTAPQGAEGEP